MDNTVDYIRALEVQDLNIYDVCLGHCPWSKYLNMFTLCNSAPHEVFCMIRGRKLLCMKGNFAPHCLYHHDLRKIDSVATYRLFGGATTKKLKVLSVEQKWKILCMHWNSHVILLFICLTCVGKLFLYGRWEGNAVAPHRPMVFIHLAWSRPVPCLPPSLAFLHFLNYGCDPYLSYFLLIACIM